MFKQMREDIATIRDRDPAAQSNFEVWWLYNGYKALRSHRRAHRLYEKTRQTFRRVLCAVPYGYKECLAAEMIAD
jgi:serine O-acetyltransferase